MRFPFSLLAIQFIYTLHYTLNTYIHSSFLSEYLPLDLVGLVFVLAAAISIIALAIAEKVLVRFGLRASTVSVLSINSLALLTLSGIELFRVSSGLIPALGVLLHYAASIFILRFAFDIYFEEDSSDETTGFTRGKVLTVANLAWVLSPLIFSRLISDSNYVLVYALSAALSIILLFIFLSYTKHIRKEPAYEKRFFTATLSEIASRKSVRNIIVSHFLLQFFFSWMIIYLPLHLRETLGFSWETIGLLFSIMLLPYVLIDLPLGYLADKVFGEKEGLFLGFLIAAFATLAISIITTTSFFLWALVLFASRIGAAAIELLTETYFFKKVSAKDGHLISAFRNATPLAYIAGPAGGSILLFLGADIEILFVILSAFMFCGIFVILPIKDTL